MVQRIGIFGGENLAGPGIEISEALPAKAARGAETASVTVKTAARSVLMQFPLMRRLSIGSALVP